MCSRTASGAVGTGEQSSVRAHRFPRLRGGIGTNRATTWTQTLRWFRRALLAQRGTRIHVALVTGSMPVWTGRSPAAPDPAQIAVTRLPRIPAHRASRRGRTSTNRKARSATAVRRYGIARPGLGSWTLPLMPGLRIRATRPTRTHGAVSRARRNPSVAAPVPPCGLQKLARRTGNGSLRSRMTLNLPIALAGFCRRHGWARVEGSDCPAFAPTDAVPREQPT
jgi:hypothetical protein